jgi:hypothetical protein
VPAEIREASAFDWMLGLVSQMINSLAPVVLPNGLAGAVYRRFLVNDLSTILEHVPLYQRQHMWFMHDGAPPHCLRLARQRLKQTFG